MLDYGANREAIERIKEIDKKRIEEDSKEVANNRMLTQLMFEQMLRGLYLNNGNYYN